MAVRHRNGRPADPIAGSRRKSREPSPSAESLIPVEGLSMPAQLNLFTKWAIVLIATCFTVYFFEARAFVFTEWLFSIRAAIYTTMVFTMIGSLPFPWLRPGVFAIMVIYECVLIFIISSGYDLHDVRQLINTTALSPLNETAYDHDCKVYDAGHPRPFHNIIDSVDHFVWFHVVGYLFKFLFIRSWWLVHTLSVSFELLEYSLEHHLPNFKECWWDHWIADALLSNVLGMCLGSLMIDFCKFERYQWRMLVTPTVRSAPSSANPQGRIKLFRPRHIRLRNMLLIGFIVALVMVGELNTFYIKFLVWIPPEHWYNCLRVLIAVSASMPATNEVYCELQGRKRRLMPYLFCLGVCAVQLTELLAHVKLGHREFTVPFPQHIIVLWAGIALVCIAYVVWRLCVRYILLGPEEDEVAGEEHYERVQRLKEKGLMK